MKKLTLTTIAVLSLLCLPALAQTNTVKDRVLELGQGISEAKAFSLALYPGYAPNLTIDGVKRQWGGGAALLYPVYDNGAIGGFVGARLDYMADRFYMPSATVGLQAHIRLYGIDTTPFALGGAIFPLGGAGDQNGEVGAIVGGGFAADLFKFGRRSDGTNLGKVTLFYATEYWSLFPDTLIHRPGINLSIRF